MLVLVCGVTTILFLWSHGLPVCVRFLLLRCDDYQVSLGSCLFFLVMPVLFCLHIIILFLYSPELLLFAGSWIFCYCDVKTFRYLLGSLLSYYETLWLHRFFGGHDYPASIRSWLPCFCEGMTIILLLGHDCPVRSWLSCFCKVMTVLFL